MKNRAALYKKVKTTQWKWFKDKKSFNLGSYFCFTALNLDYLKKFIELHVEILNERFKKN